jgi:hypothetical protein
LYKELRGNEIKPPNELSSAVLLNFNMDGNSILSQSPMLCFDAQTYLGSANEYNNGDLNPDVGGAFTAISSQYPSFVSERRVPHRFGIIRYCHQYNPA